MAETVSTAPPTAALEREREARRRVAALKGFYVHASVFALVMAGLFLIDWLGGGNWWVHWVFLGWGVGVLGHAFGVSSNVSQRVARWEEQKVQQLMRE